MRTASVGTVLSLYLPQVITFSVYAPLAPPALGENISLGRVCGCNTEREIRSFPATITCTAHSTSYDLFFVSHPPRYGEAKGLCTRFFTMYDSAWSTTTRTGSTLHLIVRPVFVFS